MSEWMDTRDQNGYRSQGQGWYQGNNNSRGRGGSSRGRGRGSSRGRGGYQYGGNRGGYSQGYGSRGQGYKGERSGWVENIDKFCELHGHKQTVRLVTLVTEPSQRQVVYSGSRDNTVRVWDLSMPRNQQCTNCVPVGDDVGSLLVASGWLFVGIPGKVKCWNMTDNSQFDLMGHHGQVHSLAPYTEQGMVFSGGDDRSIRAWRFNAQTSHFDLVGTMEGHSAAVLEMQIIGNLLFSADISGVIKVWDLNTAQCTFTCHAHQSAVMGILLWENHLLSCSLDGTVKVWSWNPNSNSLEQNFSHTIDQNGQVGVLGMCGSVNASQKPVLVTACNDSTIRFFELPTFDTLGVLKQRMEVRVVSSGPGMFFAGHGDGTIRVWKWK